MMESGCGRHKKILFTGDDISVVSFEKQPHKPHILGPFCFQMFTRLLSHKRHTTRCRVEYPV